MIDHKMSGTSIIVLQEVDNVRCSMEVTRRHLRRALDRDLALYERYVPNKRILVEYLEETKRALILAVQDAFDEKIQSL